MTRVRTNTYIEDTGKHMTLPIDTPFNRLKQLEYGKASNIPVFKSNLRRIGRNIGLIYHMERGEYFISIRNMRSSLHVPKKTITWDITMETH